MPIARAKRIARIVVGFALLAVGILLVPLPGPGWLTIGLALGILASEFVWAERLLDRLKQGARRIQEAALGSNRRDGKRSQ
jgi:uncharacterized protein (TIGR02611 family)